MPAPPEGPQPPFDDDDDDDDDSGGGDVDDVDGGDDDVAGEGTGSGSDWGSATLSASFGQQICKTIIICSSWNTFVRSFVRPPKT